MVVDKTKSPKGSFCAKMGFYLLEVGDNSLISISAFFGLDRKCTIQIRGATHGFGYDWGDKLGNVLDCAIGSILPEKWVEDIRS